MTLVARVHAFRHRPILSIGGPLYVHLFVPGHEAAKVLCRQATDALVAAAAGSVVRTRLARCKGTAGWGVARREPPGYSRQVEVPDADVLTALSAIVSFLVRHGVTCDVRLDAELSGEAWEGTVGTPFYVVTACDDPSHVQRVVQSGKAPCACCVATSVPAVDPREETFRVEWLLTEAVCEWLPIVLQGTPAEGTYCGGRMVSVDDAREFAGHLLFVRDSLPAADREDDWAEATTALHEAAQACYALATCAFANVGRTRLLAETIRRAVAVGNLAKKIDRGRYESAVRHARIAGML